MRLSRAKTSFNKMTTGGAFNTWKPTQLAALTLTRSMAFSEKNFFAKEAVLEDEESIKLYNELKDSCSSLEDFYNKISYPGSLLVNMYSRNRQVLSHMIRTGEVSLTTTDQEFLELDGMPTPDPRANLTSYNLFIRKMKDKSGELSAHHKRLLSRAIIKAAALERAVLAQGKEEDDLKNVSARVLTHCRDLEELGLAGMAHYNRARLYACPNLPADLLPFDGLKEELEKGLALKDVSTIRWYSSVLEREGKLDEAIKVLKDGEVLTGENAIVSLVRRYGIILMKNPETREEGIKYLEENANRGDRYAMRTLGRVHPDQETGLKWLEKAAKLGVQHATEMLEKKKLGKLLTK